MAAEDKFRLFVGGLPPVTQQVHVTSYFANFGQVLNVNIRCNTVGQCLGYGFIEMANKQSVDRILASVPHFLVGHKIDVKPYIKMSDDLRIFIGGLDPQTTDESLKQYFSQYGTIIDGSIRVDPKTGRGRGFAILTYTDENSVTAAVAMDRHLVDGKVVEVKRIDKTATRTRSDANPIDEPNNLFIGGLSPQTTPESLKEYYSKFGQVIETNVATDKTNGKRRGFGFVRYSNADDLARCMAARPHAIDGKMVETKRALSHDDAKNMFTVTKLFVGALKPCHNEQNLRAYFGSYGNILTVQMTNRKDGSDGHRGYAFITFDDYDAVDQIILQRNHIVEGVAVDCHKGLSKDEMTKLQLQAERDRLSREQRSAASATTFPGMGGIAGSGHMPAPVPPVGGNSYMSSGGNYHANGHNNVKQQQMSPSWDYTMRDITSKPSAPSNVKQEVCHVRGDTFRQLLQSTECSAQGITTLQNENLLDSTILLSLTSSEFDNLPLSIGDRKRVELALRSLQLSQID